jgi:hypothetical protein
VSSLDLLQCLCKLLVVCIEFGWPIVAVVRRHVVSSSDHSLSIAIPIVVGNTGFVLTRLDAWVSSRITKFRLFAVPVAHGFEEPLFDFS